ncbi:MAG: MBL fold metallo-hydrolase [Proteobacteria bacterium]|nr:MBL fold metallo-hydrolase [Pseudomonadota bacterium]
MIVHFLGVRGSLPCADKEYVEYGGHTSCVLVECDDTVLIFDAGTGIVNAYPFLKNKKDIYLFLSHIHLDHIFGLPFFKPVWDRHVNLHIYCGTLSPYGGIQKSLQTLFSPPYFPVSYLDWPSQKKEIHFNASDDLIINENIVINTFALNHPNGSVGYRVNYKNKSVCYITDHEHTPEQTLNTDFVNFLKDTDLMIYDSAYCDDVYPKHKGWGHSTWQEAQKLGLKAKAKCVGIYHHDLANNDDIMKSIERETLNSVPKMIVCKQNQKIEIA